MRKFLLLAWCFVFLLPFSAQATLADGVIYPEEYGAVGDCVTDDSAALQAWINAGQARPFKPEMRLKNACYKYDTGLTITAPQGMNFKGVGGYYTPTYTGYNGQVSTLYYTGTGKALEISTGNATGLTFENIYFKGTSAASTGVSHNNVAGVVYKGCTFGQFSKPYAAGVEGFNSHVNVFYNCAFINNWLGSGLKDSNSPNTTWSFYSCVWHSNMVGHYEERAQKTSIYNGVFQGDVDKGGSAVVISPVGGQGIDCTGFTMIGGYISSMNNGSSGWGIDISGYNDTDYAYTGLVLKDITWASPGAYSQGDIRLVRTRRAVIDNIQFVAVPPKIMAGVTSPNANSELLIYNWNSAFPDSSIVDGSGNPMYWAKTMASQPYGYEIRGDRTLIRQPNPASSREALAVQQDAPSKALVDFVGTSATDTAHSISTKTTGTIGGFIKIEVNGAEKWIPYYNSIQ